MQHMAKIALDALFAITTILGVAVGVVPVSAADPRTAASGVKICDDPSPVGEVLGIVACHHFDDLGESKELSALPNVITTYRLLASPSFQHPIIVRIDIRSSENATITIRTRERIRNADQMSDDINIRSEKLSAVEIHRLIRTVDRSRFWTLPASAVVQSSLRSLTEPSWSECAGTGRTQPSKPWKVADTTLPVPVAER